MVQDTGIGIDESISHRIFDPFFTTKDIGRGAGLRGTGLGLSSVYGILKNHDGFITVDSVKNKGSLFSFYLPVTEKKIAHEKTYSDITPKGAETILIVDDEEIIVTVTARMMKRMGYKVLVAMSGEEAVNIYREKMSKIDMVIVDMVMPGIGGSETYDALKNINSNVKVLLSSGYSLMGEATKILDRGCNGFLQKPFNAKQLSQKIREILDVNSCDVS
jgi:CheY-like chemotaxis protein